MTSQEAKEIAQKWIASRIGSETAVIPGDLFEDDWYFVFSMDTKDRRHYFVGSGPSILDKRDGRVFNYGSGWSMGPVAELLEYHGRNAAKESVIRRSFPEYDIRKHYRVFIREVYDHQRLLEMLDSFQLGYVFPEVESDVIWRIGKRYDKELLRRRLAEPLPVTFGALGSLERLYQLLVSDERGKLCKIDIEEYHKRKRSWNPATAKPEDLQPEW